VKFDAPDAWVLLRDAGAAWLDDRASTMGAAIAYYTMFSVAPLGLIVVAIAGIVFGEQAARGEIAHALSGVIGHDGALAVQSLLEHVNQPFGGVLATTVGVGVLLFGATTVFSELQSALDRVWRVPPAPPEHGVWMWIRARVLSLALILAIGIMVMASILVSAALTALRLRSPLAGSDVLAFSRLVDFVVSFTLVTVAFAFVYKWMPRIRIQWRDVWMGAIMTSLLFNAGKALIGLYIGTSGITSPFGAAGSLVAFIVWVYWSAQIFLFGAELTRVYAFHKGSRHAPIVLSRRAGDGDGAVTDERGAVESLEAARFERRSAPGNGDRRRAA
jgi:membrane protein